MIFTLFFACILPGPDLIGDSDRPFEPPTNQLDDGNGNGGEDSELSVSVDGDELSVEHDNVELPCDFDDSEVGIYVDESELHIEVVYSERDPEDCYRDLDYTIDLSDYPYGSYTFEAHGDETTFEY